MKGARKGVRIFTAAARRPIRIYPQARHCDGATSCRPQAGCPLTDSGRLSPGRRPPQRLAWRLSQRMSAPTPGSFS